VDDGEGYGVNVIEPLTQVIYDGVEGEDGRGSFELDRLLRSARNDDVGGCNDGDRLLRFARNDDTGRGNDDVGRLEDDPSPFGQQGEAFNDLVILEVALHAGTQQAGFLKVAKLAAHGIERFAGQARSLPCIIAGIYIGQEKFQQVALGLGGDKILQRGHQ